jgi:hypothetical protein
MAEHHHEQHPEKSARHEHDELVSSGGGLHYQQGHRDPGAIDGAPRSSAPAGEPSLRQRAEEYGGPDPEDEALLHEQGYPKLGQKLPSRVTQVEHGPYAGGSQQGDGEPEPSGAATTPRT